MSRLEDCCNRCPSCSRVLTCDVESLCRHRNPVCDGCCPETHHEELLAEWMAQGWAS